MPINQLPDIDELNEYVQTMQEYIRLADELVDVRKALPGADELNEYVQTMQEYVRLTEELADLQRS